MSLILRGKCWDADSISPDHYWERFITPNLEGKKQMMWANLKITRNERKIPEGGCLRLAWMGRNNVLVGWVTEKKHLRSLNGTIS